MTISKFFSVAKKIRSNGPKFVLKLAFCQIGTYAMPPFVGIFNRRKWSRMINGRSIAIVGPAPLISEAQLKEIEGHDVIIRVGHEHWRSGAVGRTDVWLLDGGATDDFLELFIEPKDSEWILLKGPINLYSFFRAKRSFKERFKKLRIVRRRFPLLMRVPWLWHPNQVPLVAMELSFLKPRIVRVYGSDFYTTSGEAYGAHSPYREPALEDWKSFTQKMFRSHDQIDQKRALLHLDENYLHFKGDKRFIELMNLEEEEFEAKLCQ